MRSSLRCMARSPSPVRRGYRSFLSSFTSCTSRALSSQSRDQLELAKLLRSGLMSFLVIQTIIEANFYITCYFSTFRAQHFSDYFFSSILVWLSLSILLKNQIFSRTDYIKLHSPIAKLCSLHICSQLLLAGPFFNSSYCYTIRYLSKRHSYLFSYSSLLSQDKRADLPSQSQRSYANSFRMLRCQSALFQSQAFIRTIKFYFYQALSQRPILSWSASSSYALSLPSSCSLNVFYMLTRYCKFDIVYQHWAIIASLSLASFSDIQQRLASSQLLFYRENTCYCSLAADLPRQSLKFYLSLMIVFSIDFLRDQWPDWQVLSFSQEILFFQFMTFRAPSSYLYFFCTFEKVSFKLRSSSINQSFQFLIDQALRVDYQSLRVS